MNRHTVNTEFATMTPLLRAGAMGNRFVSSSLTVNGLLQLQHALGCTPRLDTNNNITHFLGALKDCRNSLSAIGVISKEILGSFCVIFCHDSLPQ